MPADDLTALGQKMRETRKRKGLTQQELSDLSHVPVKQIANIEKGWMNPACLILRVLAKVLHISLGSLINSDISLGDDRANQMKMLYFSCPSKMHETLLHHMQEITRELTELSEEMEVRQASKRNLNIPSLAYFIPVGKRLLGKKILSETEVETLEAAKKDRKQFLAKNQEIAIYRPSPIDYKSENFRQKSPLSQIYQLLQHFFICYCMSRRIQFGIRRIVLRRRRFNRSTLMFCTCTSINLSGFQL